MYNNEVTYHDKWKTKENKKYRDLVMKWGYRTACWSGCPVSWAKEVYEFLQDLDETFGLYSNPAWRYYYTPDGFYRVFVKKPFEILFGELPKYMGNPRFMENKPKWKKYWRFFKYRVNFYGEVWHDVKRYFRQIQNDLRIWYRKPKIQVSQIKEKYGEFRFYYDADEATSKYVEYKIKELEIKLAQKGAYYPLTSLYDWSTMSSIGENLEPDYKIEEKSYDGSDGTVRKYAYVTNYEYRKIMKREGVDLYELEKEARKEK